MCVAARARVPREAARVSLATMDSTPVADVINKKLTATFAPTTLEVINESSKHNVPRGAETHFKVVVISECWKGISLLERHRAINEALATELQNGVHALSIVAKTPEQWQKAGGAIGESPECMGGAKR